MKFFIVLSLAIALFDAIPKKAFGMKSADLKPSTVGISHREVGQTIYEDVKIMVKESVVNSLGPQGFRSIIFPGKTVLIKPNIVGLKRGVMTDIRVVRATAELAKEAAGPAGKVYIAESLWGDDHYRLAGYDKNGDFIDDLTGTRLINLEKFRTTPVKVKNGFIWEEFNIPDIAIKADVFISVAVFKNHYSAGVTGALKNAVGIVKLKDYSRPGSKDTYRSRLHYKHGQEQEGYWLNETIVDLNLARHCDFAVVDGLTGLLNGPVTYGKMGDPEIIEPNLIISGKDAVAVDTVETLLMGYDPDSISYLKMAGQKGLGTSDPASININGISVDSIRKNLYKKYHGEIPKAPNLGKHRYPFPDKYSSVYPLRSQKAADPNIAMLYKDREPPQKVSFKNFPDNSLVTRDRCIDFEAIDNSGLSKVEVYIDGKIYKILAKDEKRFCFDDASIKGGRHGLRLKAYDRYLNEAYGKAVTFIYTNAKGSIKIPHVGESFNLDGVLDESAWKQAFRIYIDGENSSVNPGWNPYNEKNIRKDDLSFDLYAFHDGKNLYFGFDVKDDDISSDSVALGKEIYCDDCVEIFLDGDNDKSDPTESYALKAPKSFFSKEGFVPHFGILNPKPWDGYEILWFAKSKVKSGSEGYTVELKIPFSSIDTLDGGGFRPLKPGDTIGFNFLVNDDDKGGDREHQLSWLGATHDNTLYKSSQMWGEAFIEPKK